MATPDLRSLYELYRQMYGGSASPLGPAGSESGISPQYPGQAYTQQRDIPRTSGGYAPGGALGGFDPLPTGGPRWGQASVFLEPMPIGWRGPTSVRAFRRPFFPFPSGPDTTIDIPMPKTPERHIPHGILGAGIVAALMPWILARRMQVDGRLDGSTEQQSDPSSPEPPLEQPPDGGGVPSTGILGLLLQEAARRLQSAPSEEQRLPERSDPDVRLLRRVPSSSEREDAPGPEDSPRPLREIGSPPLVPEQEPPPTLSDGDGDGNGGGDGGRGSGGNDNDRRRECTEAWMDETENWCPQFRFVGPGYERACVDRANDRLSTCHGNSPQPDQYSMRDIPDEIVRKFWARQRAATKRPRTNSKKRRR